MTQNRKRKLMRRCGSLLSPPALLLMLAYSAFDPNEAFAEVQSRAECRNSNLLRIVSHRTYTEAGAVCDVYYEKPTEQAVPSVLWTAKADTSYCAAKFDGFVKKLTALGWRCTGKQDVQPMLHIQSDVVSRTTQILDKKRRFAGYVGDYFALPEGDSTFIVKGQNFATLELSVSVKSGSVQVVSKPVDAHGACQYGSRPVPAKIVASWGTTPIQSVGMGVKRVSLARPTFKARKPPGCSHQPSEIGALKWVNHIIQIDSNVADAAIYQHDRRGGQELISGVTAGTRFSAVFHQIQRELAFTLRKAGYSNCTLLIEAPPTADRHYCELLRIPPEN